VTRFSRVDSFKRQHATAFDSRAARRHASILPLTIFDLPSVTIPPFSAITAEILPIVTASAVAKHKMLPVAKTTGTVSCRMDSTAASSSERSRKVNVPSISNATALIKVHGQRWLRTTAKRWLCSFSRVFLQTPPKISLHLQQGSESLQGVLCVCLLSISQIQPESRSVPQYMATDRSGWIAEKCVRF